MHVLKTIYFSLEFFVYFSWKKIYIGYLVVLLPTLVHRNVYTIYIPTFFQGLGFSIDT